MLKAILHPSAVLLSGCYLDVTTACRKRKFELLVARDYGLQGVPIECLKLHFSGRFCQHQRARTTKWESCRGVA